MSSRLNKTIIVIVFVMATAAIVSAGQISAQPEKKESKITQKISETSKISPELQKVINESPHEIVLVTISLKEHPLHDISIKKQEKYEPKIRDIQSKVQTYYKEARKTALAKKNNADINANSKVKINDETSTDIVSALTDAEKQNIFEENSKFEKTKQEMIQEIISNTKEKIQPQQQKIKNKIEELGGSIEGEGAFYSVVFARISANKIKDIEDLPEVEFIEKTGISKPDMDISSYSIYANTFWNNGYNGTPYEAGVADTGVDSTHPALSSRVIAAKDFVPNDSDGNNTDDLDGHGTHVSGTVASTDSTYKGIAYGANIINLKIGNSSIDYRAYDSDVMAGVDWAIYGTSDPAEIISHSYGGTTGKSRFFDAVVDDLGLTVSVSAGNDGPDSSTVGYDSYNSIVVGAMDDKNTVSRADDTIASYSSRGPVPGTNRIKPDIMAPGSNIKSAAYNWEGLFGLNPDFVEMSGTSMAAPHISGAAALLMSAGVYDPREIKALLINTAEDKGTVGGDYDYGWGYVDLNHAFFHTPDVRLGIVNTTNRYLLYKGYAFSGDKASLVWNRHANYAGASYPIIYYSLSDLDLYMYNESDGTYISYSISNDENVEQVVSNTNTITVLKVHAYGFASGVSSEQFALASEEGFSVTSLPNLRLEISNPNIVGPNKNFNISINVTNSGDVSAHNVNVTLSFPSGFTIISGSNFYNLGSIAAGNGKNATWTVSSSSVGGSYSLNANITSISYGETYTAYNSSTILVDSTPPVIIANPTGYPANQNAAKNGSLITLNASIIDLGAGVKNATVNVSQINSSLADIILIYAGAYWTNSSIFVSALDGIYYLNVTAYDNASNVNSSGQLMVKVDNTSPSVISNPTGYPAGQTAAKNGTMITLNASVYDAFAGVRNVSVNASLINSSRDVVLTNTSGFWTNSSIFVSALDGIYLLNITAFDNASNINSSAQIAVTVDNTPPNATAWIQYTKGNAANNDSTVKINATAHDNLAGVKNVTANVSAISSAGVISLSYNDGFWIGSFIVGGQDGNYSINITLFDNASNVNYTQVNVSIDNSPPSVSDVSVSASFINVTASTVISANITTNDNVSQVSASEVFARVACPNGTSINYLMSANGSLFNLTFTDTAQYGRFNVTILANDTTGNTNSTQGTQFVTTFMINLSVVTNATNETVILAPLSNTTLRLLTNKSSMGEINITQSRVNITSRAMTITNPGIYVLVNASDSIKNNLSYAVISVNYTDAEASSYVESSLRLYRWNTTSMDWDKLSGAGSHSYANDAGVDTVNKFVCANLTALSEFAVAGDIYVAPPPPPPSSGGGGGGGGGGTSGEDYANIEVKEKYDLHIFKDRVTSYAFTNSSNPVLFVNITGNVNAGEITTSVEVLRNTSSLVKNPAPGMVYKNINIWVGTSGFPVPRNIKEGVIRFRVENLWLASSGFAPSDLSLLQWSGDQWNRLETSTACKDDKYTFFEAKADHFSPFAISASKGAAPLVTPSLARETLMSTVTATPASTLTPPAQPGIPIWGFGIIIVLAALGIAAYYLFTLKKKPGGG